VANIESGAASFVGGRACGSVIWWLTSGQYKSGAASFVGGRPWGLVIWWLTSGQYKKWRGQFCWWQAMSFGHMVGDKWPIQKEARPVLLVAGNVVRS
jgi:hypothetical protein